VGRTATSRPVAVRRTAVGAALAVTLGLVVVGGWAAVARSASVADRTVHAEVAAVAGVAADGELRADARAGMPSADDGAEGAAAWPTGIFEDPEAPARASEFVGTNRWVGQGGPGTLAVWAGRSGEDVTRGRVLVGTFDGQQQVVSRDTVDLPATGPLRIVSAHGVVLRLVDAAGRPHRFDAATGAFL
jgi:hypothetical protein